MNTFTPELQKQFNQVFAPEYWIETSVNRAGFTHNVYHVVEKIGGNVRVLKSFDELSNDWALTSANEMLAELKGK